MTLSLDDFDLFPAPSAGLGQPRKCRRHHWVDGSCANCNRPHDAATSRRGRNNRARGGRDELAVARLLGGRKVGPLGLPHDVEVPGWMRVQCKQLDRWPSLASVISWIDAMQPAGDIRAVSVADTPGPGGRTRRLLIVDLDEFARWHGKAEPESIVGQLPDGSLARLEDIR